MRRRAAFLAALISPLLIFAAHAQIEDSRTTVLVFTPTTEGNTYWPEVHEILEDAALDFGIELLFYSFDVGDRFAKTQEGVRILQSEEHVDAAIFSVAFGQTLPLLQITEQMKIPVMIQGPLFERELPALGNLPRQRFASWAGVFQEDEFGKGRALADVLIETALAGGMTNRDGSVSVVGIGGDPSWYGSTRRESGLTAAVIRHPEARLVQVVPTLWTEEEGYAIATSLLRRYPEATVFWAASDQLAIGASRALREAGRTIGGDVVVGGLDLSRQGLEAVARGDLTATSASPMVSYARILTYLFDYLSGSDFAEPAGTEILLPITTATAANANEFLELYDQHGRIDYRQYSRSLNVGLAAYDFSLERLQTTMAR